MYIKGSAHVQRGVIYLVAPCSECQHSEFESPLTLLAAVDLVVFNHKRFKLAQQLHRLLPDKEKP